MTSVREILIHWFIPPALREDKETQRQALRAMLFGLAMLVWVPIYTLVYWLLDAPKSVAMVALVGVGILMAMGSMRFTKSVKLTGNLIAGVIFAVLISLACVTGGIKAASLWWLPSVPIIALVLSGIPSGIAWTVLGCLASATFYGIDLAGHTWPSELDEDAFRILTCNAISGIIVCACILTVLFKLGEDKARTALEIARDESEQANRAKSAFLANMSHEIRTPMNAIMGMTELVLGTELKPQQREYLLIVQESSEALRVLINDILDFSKIEAGRLSLELQTFDLHDTIGSSMKSMGVRAHTRGLELVFHLQDGVPRMVVGDEVRLRQIIVNLVGNAIKFTEQGEVVLKVSCLRTTEDSAWLEFAVTDTGIGIPKEKQQVIFDTFEQADMSTTRKFGGTGLGLAISSKLVRLMDGHIYVESEYGKGSTFQFTARFGLVQEEAAATTATRPVVLHDARVLVVDDNATNRRILEEVLRRWKLETKVVDNAQDALNTLRQARSQGAPFNLVLTDAHMPDVDGFSFAKQIKEDSELRNETVVMMLTSGDHPEDLGRCEQLGIASYLLKPIKQSELLDAVLTALGAKHAEQPGVASQHAALDSDQPQATGPVKVLLVEDSVVNQKLAAAVLEKDGHHVTIANNGLEAVQAFERDSFDLVLMDIQMPEMDGFEATRAIRKLEQITGGHIPIIAMTAHALVGDRERCLASGMDDYIAKPIYAKQLIATIRRLGKP
jgi:two-component system sensor histidine kinase/response regulator